MKKRILIATTLLATWLVASASAVTVEEIVDNTQYHPSVADTGVALAVAQDELQFTATEIAGVSVWLRIEDTAGEKVEQSVVDMEEGAATTTLSLEGLDQSQSYSLSIYVKSSEDDTAFWSYLPAGKVTLEYQSAQWLFQEVEGQVLSQNYNGFYGNQAMTYPTVTQSDVIALSNEICQGLTTDYEKIDAIDSWVTQNIYYDYDNSATRTTTEVLASNTATAEDVAVLVQELALAQGIPCIVVEGYALGLGEETTWSTQTVATKTANHSWNEVYVEEQDRWVIVDTAWNIRNQLTEGEYTSYEGTKAYFDLSVAALSLDHKIIETPKNADPVNNDVMVYSSWAESDIDTAISRGIVSGDLWCNFTDGISRSSFCKLAAGLVESLSGQSLEEMVAQRDTSDRTDLFTDTAIDDVALLYQLSVVNGVGDNLFQPDSTITRQEAAKLLSAIVELFPTTTTGTAPTFSDQETIASWAVESVEQMASLGIMEGSDGAFDPQGTYTLEQAIITMNRLYSLLA